MSILFRLISLLVDIHKQDNIFKIFCFGFNLLMDVKIQQQKNVDLQILKTNLQNIDIIFESIGQSRGAGEKTCKIRQK